jgi:hypothetical protein
MVSQIREGSSIKVENDGFLVLNPVDVNDVVQYEQPVGEKDTVIDQSEVVVVVVMVEGG